MSKHEDEDSEESYEGSDLDERYPPGSQQHHDDDFDEFEEDAGNTSHSTTKPQQPPVNASITSMTSAGSEVTDDTDTHEPAMAEKTAVVKNQPHDEVIEASDDESEAHSVPSPHASIEREKQIITKPNTNVTGPAVQSSLTSLTAEDEDESEEEESEEDEDEDEDEEDGGHSGMMSSREYNPADYAHLPVSREVKELFQFITAYKPQHVELETKLKPFIPDYIPAVGDLDPFLKIPRPDGNPDFLGLKVLDEPAAKQSDPTVIQLNLSYLSRDLKSKPVQVNSVEAADKNKKKILKWIDDIKELHKTKPPPTVNPSKPMPDINKLMQAWPDAFEELLQNVELPGPEIDLELEEYVRLICTLLDIPVHANMIESLYWLFTLYLEFKTNQHFNQQYQL